MTGMTKFFVSCQWDINLAGISSSWLLGIITDLGVFSNVLTISAL